MKPRPPAALTCFAAIAISVLSCLVARPVSAASAWPLGTFEPGTRTATSQNFTVRCPGLTAPAPGTLWIDPPTTTPRGMVVGFSGGYGNTKWVENFSMDATWLSNVKAAGYEVVQVQWAQPGWEPASSGENAGAAHAGCRPATAIRWIYDNIYPGLHVPKPGLGVCGFCIAGTSGGASQVSYALAYYGLAPILNAVFPISGPPHAALTKGCLSTSGYAYSALANGAMALALIDSSFGYFNGTGPCTKHDSSFTSRWNAESVDKGGTSYYYPTTRVHFILGQYDSPVIRNHTQDYISRLTANGSPLVSSEIVPKMPHDIMSSAAGLAALLAAIKAGPSKSKASPPPITTSPNSPTSPSSSATSSPGALPSGANTPGASFSPGGPQTTPSVIGKILANLRQPAAHPILWALAVALIALTVLVLVWVVMRRDWILRRRKGSGRQ